MRVKLNKKLAAFCVMVGVIFFTIDWVGDHLVVNTSHSHSGTLFWQSNDQPAAGDYVFFEFTHPLIKGAKILSKRLICLPNEYVLINEKMIYCNDKEYLIERTTHSGSDQSIPQFYYQGIVPNGKAIVYGENKESFDSRYYGFVELHQLRQMKLIF